MPSFGIDSETLSKFFPESLILPSTSLSLKQAGRPNLLKALETKEFVGKKGVIRPGDDAPDSMEF